MYEERTRSNWWYLLPIFIGALGGIIAYFAVRRDDPRKAKKCLYLGLGLTALQLVLNLAVGLSAPWIMYDPDISAGF